MMNRKTKNQNWPRLVIQIGIVAYILLLFFVPGFLGKTIVDFEAYCPFGGLQALGSYLLNQALSCTMTSAQIVTGIALFIGVILFSKLFCSFICPVGTISEWLGKAGQKLRMRFTIKGIADLILRSLKYILLFITLYFTLQSNELFCKKYDPYYALASGFDTDVVLLYAAIALAVWIIGSIFVRLFWCKYLCPLGAISNIFRFTLFFAGVIVVYLVLLAAGVQISYVWPLAIACAGGYLIEISGLESRFFPVARITRNTTSCINCNLCTLKCPQAIDVAKLNTVKHIDCHLCGDCLQVCPVDNTLTINKKKKLNRLPVIAVIILATLAVIMGNTWEVPTIDERWGQPEEISKAAVFEQSGLKNIKCYGSSMVFANKMRDVEGVFGVATYVKHNRVKLYYDPEILDETKIQELLFTPQKKPVRPLAKGVNTVYEITLLLQNFFDSFDFSYLSVLLSQKTNAVGLVSEFACPVIVKIYFPEKISSEELIEIIESKSLTYETTTGETTVELKYKVEGTPAWNEISRNEYITLLFTPYKSSFNDRKNYTEEVVRKFVVPLEKNRALQNRYAYLVSHLSNDSGIIGFETRLDSLFNEVAEIFYVDSITNPFRIETALLSDSLEITYTNGSTSKVENMFDFSEILRQKNVTDTITSE